MPTYQSIQQTHAQQSRTTSGSPHSEATASWDNATMQALLRAGVGTALLDIIESGATLAEGDKGTEVQEAQSLLGFTNADGAFGPVTKRAIVLFQSARGLTPTGTFGGSELLALADNHRAQTPEALLFQLQTRGASRQTASQSGLSGGGQASIEMASEDADRLLPYRAVFADIAQRYDLPAALLAAIGSRETRGGAHLDKDGYSIFDGAGFGLMQVDKNHHTPAGGAFSEEHITQAAQILAGMRDQLRRKHHDWSEAELLRGAVAAYNTGASRVRSASGMDRYTTGRDYSSDVWIRAQHYASLFSDTLPSS